MVHVRDTGKAIDESAAYAAWVSEHDISIEGQTHTEQVLAYDGTHQLSTLVIHEIFLTLQRQETIVPLRHVFSSDDFVHPTALHAFDRFSVD